MNKLYFLLSFLMVACAANTVETNEAVVPEKAVIAKDPLPTTHYVKFRLNGVQRSIEGKSDIESAFYSYNWPEYHTPKHIKETRMQNQDVFCGRMTNAAKNKMVEMFFTFPKGKKLTVMDFNSLVGKRISVGYKEKEVYSRFYFFDTDHEYSEDTDTKGYLQVGRICSSTDFTVLAEGSFDLNVREYGQSDTHPCKGTFLLEFYIGL